MLASLLSRLRRQRRGRRVEHVRIEKTDHGWRVYYLDPDPEKRYQPIPPAELKRLRRRAEAEYTERQQRRDLAGAL